MQKLSQTETKSILNNLISKVKGAGGDIRQFAVDNPGTTGAAVAAPLGFAAGSFMGKRNHALKQFLTALVAAGAGGAIGRKLGEPGDLPTSVTPVSAPPTAAV